MESSFKRKELNSASKFTNSGWTSAPTGHRQKGMLLLVFAAINVISFFSLPYNRKRETWSWLRGLASHYWRRTGLWRSRMITWSFKWDRSRRRSVHTQAHMFRLYQSASCITIDVHVTSVTMWKWTVTGIWCLPGGSAAPRAEPQGRAAAVLHECCWGEWGWRQQLPNVSILSTAFF